MLNNHFGLGLLFEVVFLLLPIPEFAKLFASTLEPFKLSLEPFLLSSESYSTSYLFLFLGATAFESSGIT
jgi:hypothetical protein